MVRIRRHMHEYPENSGVEYETVKYIASELDALGIEYVVVPEGGIIGQIHGGKPGKTVLLRADMDALPIKESKTNLTKEKVCISKNDGISHACGHDAHTAMLLAEAKILNENKEDLNGNIVLLFERGEEAGGNIRNLLPYAVETMKLKIDTCMATHVNGMFRQERSPRSRARYSPVHMDLSSSFTARLVTDPVRILPTVF